MEIKEFSEIIIKNTQIERIIVQPSFVNCSLQELINTIELCEKLHNLCLVNLTPL